MSKQVPVRAIRWANGMLMVFDGLGDQVPEYQGEVEECLPRLRGDFPNIWVDGLAGIGVPWEPL